MPRHPLGGTSRRGAHLCVGAEGLLLTADAGRCRDESSPWDYISGLPKVGDLGSIIVVVDRLSKYATFIAAPKHVTAEGMTHLFFKHIVKYWGLPKNIVSDRDSRFTGVFWIELFKIHESKLSISSSYHPQSDGQTERFNSMLEEYLQHFVRAQKRMKTYANPRLSKSSRGRDPQLMQKHVSLLPVMKRIGTLKKYSADREDDARNQPSRPQLELTKTKEKLAEAILNHRVTRTAKREHIEYLVKWNGCSSEENTWERVTNLKAIPPKCDAPRR
ncbi:UNVERIFIED_CONTAM: Transposon Ty3-I Gag-Pol polyprotein [Sesamum radiatum]|uniref:Transposon Ty3-I Gag-Pol polyprotein n=1 Tax=Sesamum radiatum TaxID=300843 RepID=A0AAW2U7V9_SESRA